ncbi:MULTISPECIES: immunity 52 family protein [Burkholderia]|uniref:LysR family transcriptional regulator n=1 Tax=Burkholderia savannae TaxID=1637837 RepID=A0ABR5TBX9_9BURK|nr:MULTISPECIES: immunity 52 family protein [Burkholderia]AOJ68204.1 LysR family transcriptional regulator [Burkholderia savannae]KVG40588.1 LysR family transcriptional regulator [Burkholderia sp. MSMB0265]KVG84745.1 LysR family transcriptional regulator [Burkholderia sp. MSMB2040]KVG90315.1 LysR family transcriptional regulator [Burkholderia sp. MSMB2041]KVG91320.1 LysR family transcriptional regulator [Burkholderia sp. MSMB2042]
MNITASFRDSSLTAFDFPEILARVSKIIDALKAHDDSLRYENWMLKGDSQEDATRYHVYDAAGIATPAALAVLREEFRNSKDFTYVAMWDGNLTSDDGASISCHVGDKSLPDTLTLRIEGERWSAYAAISGIVSTMVAVFSPALVEVSFDEYAVKQVFDDKPGVGWMLYLPKVITQQQVPEARALIPVPAKGKQTGTIIVSVTDAPFSVDNPEHVAIANRIEIRLVDQDLLPAYVDI